jgi:hypothetical protein
MLYTSSDTTVAHADISNCTLSSWIPSVGNSYLTRNFITASWWNNMSLPGIFSHWTVTMWQGQWYFHSDVKMKLELVVIAHCKLFWHLFIIP